MEHMSPLDAMFLDAEDGDPNASMAIASVAIVDGPVPSHADLVRSIGGRLPLVPRYRQRVLRMPMNLSQPVWVDDPDFDIGYHIRRTALPAPGDRSSLYRLVGRLMSQRLDRNRPLWEYWIVEGLAGNRWAFVSKVHHCMVDGVAGNELYRLIFDESPAPIAPPPDLWHPAALPSRAELVVEAMGELARTQVSGLEQMARSVLAPGAFQQRLVETAQGLSALASSLRPVASSSLVGPTGGQRRYACEQTPLADISDIAKTFHVTVNDVVLALVTGAFRRLLLSRGDTPDPHAIRALVPVSVRRPEAHSVLDNQVAMMLPLLPVEIADPVERLTTMHARMVELKASKEPEAGGALNELARYEPFAVLSASYRMAARRGQRNVVTVMTNVPGPRNQLYVLGRPVVEILPYVPIAGSMRVGVSVLTYHGQASFGVTGDYDNAPEVDAFAEDIVAGLADLRPAAGSRAAMRAVDDAGATAGKVAPIGHRAPRPRAASGTAAPTPGPRRAAAKATPKAAARTTAPPRSRRSAG